MWDGESELFIVEGVGGFRSEAAYHEYLAREKRRHAADQPVQVYVVLWEDHNGECTIIEGVFSTREDAERLVRELDPSLSWGERYLIEQYGVQ